MKGSRQSRYRTGVRKRQKLDAIMLALATVSYMEYGHLPVMMNSTGHQRSLFIISDFSQLRRDLQHIKNTLHRMEAQGKFKE